MIWQNPWAWLGLLAIGIPVLIHLLGRRSARITRFPTLRFLASSRLMAMRRTRLSDLPLLAVRIGIIAAAVAALAQPLVLTAGRMRAREHAVARAIIVDTSASMQRATVGGATAEQAVIAARREADRLVAERGTSVVVQTLAPARALEGVVAWLGTQAGRREITIISDFQVGSLDSLDLAAVPADIGIALARVGVVADDPTVQVTTRQGRTHVLARSTVDSGRTDVEWRAVGTPDDEGRGSVGLLVGDGEQAAAEAAWAAAMSIGTAVPPANRRVAIAWESSPQRAALLRGARPPSAAWQGDVIARLSTDSLLTAVAAVADMAAAGDTSPAVVIARAKDGRPAALAASDSTDGGDRLLLFPVGGAGTLLSAALIAATMRAASDIVPADELESATVPEATLSAWQRPAASNARAVTAGDDLSDGRWFWVLALILLGLETWMRRARRESDTLEMLHDRAA